MSSPPIVLLPGSLCDERVFADQLAAFGDRASVAELTGATTIDGLADRVLQRAPDRFVAVGLSLGAIVAAAAARRAPDRIAGLALLDTNLDAPDQAQVDRRVLWGSMVRSGEYAAMLAVDWARELTAYPERNSSLIFTMAYELGATVFLEQNAALLGRTDRRADLATLSCPILIACGEQDTICPPALHEELAASTPHARLVRFDQCGHLSTLDQPAAVTGTLTEWLESCNNHTIPGGVTT